MIYAKAAALLVLVLLLFGGGYRLGGMASKTTLEGFEAAQAENTAKAVLAERASTAAELARVNAILKGYTDAPIDPITVGIATRLLEHACPASGPVPSTVAVAAGIDRATAQPRNAQAVERATQSHFDACAKDAAELAALQAVCLTPRNSP